MLVSVVLHESVAWVPSLVRQLEGVQRAVVIDNASRDSAAEQLATRTSALVVRQATNVGFGAAHNAGVEQALARWPSSEFVLLLNPDCALAPDALTTLLARLAEQPTVGAISPQLLDAHGAAHRTHRPAFFKPQLTAPPSVEDSAGEVEWLSGACLLVRVKAWREVAGFDPRYFLFFEDDDLCLRLQARGWRCWFEPSATAVHQQGTGSAPTLRVTALKAFHLARSKRLALRTWVSARAAFLYGLKSLLGAAVAVPLFLCALQPRRALRWAARGASALSRLG